MLEFSVAFSEAPFALRFPTVLQASPVHRKRITASVRNDTAPPPGSLLSLLVALLFARDPSSRYGR